GYGQAGASRENLVAGFLLSLFGSRCGLAARREPRHIATRKVRQHNSAVGICESVKDLEGRRHKTACSRPLWKTSQHPKLKTSCAWIVEKTWLFLHFRLYWHCRRYGPR